MDRLSVYITDEATMEAIRRAAFNARQSKSEYARQAVLERLERDQARELEVKHE